MGAFSLPVATLMLVVPALSVAIFLGGYHRGCRALMIQGYVMGLIAVACYDCVRVPLVMSGWIEDFIPHIGVRLIEDGDYPAVVGYLWRYFGNGGGMGMAFVAAFICFRYRLKMLLWLGEMKSALLFGVFVWACLIATILLSPDGRELMFDLTTTNLVISLIGHLVFGGALGFLIRRKISPYCLEEKWAAPGFSLFSARR
jgi:hypothetical protein